MKKQSILAVFVFSFALLVGACGSGNGNGNNPLAPGNNHGGAPFGIGGAAGGGGAGCSAANSTASCMDADNTACVDYTGGAAQGATALHNGCQGAFSNNPCPTGNIVGNCKIDGGTASEMVVHIYNVGGVTAAQAQQACTPSQQINTATYCAGN